MICFILIAVILLQAGRGQGLTGASFSGSGVQSLLGTRAADFLTKATTASAVLFLFTCIGLDIIEARRSRSLFEEQRPVAPVDVHQIQKVLEKIKAEGETKSKETEVAVPKTETTASESKSGDTVGVSGVTQEGEKAGAQEKKD
jgi:preprotein translocase subunit SecG